MPIAVFAATGNEDAEVALLQEGEFSAMPFSNTNESTTGSGSLIGRPSNDPVQDYIYLRLSNCSTSFSLYSYKIQVDDFRDIYCDVINDNPDLFYVSSSVNYSYYKTSGYVSTIRPEYTMSKSEIEGAKAVFNANVDKALSVVDDSMTDLQKALVIHDYICDLAVYPYDAVTNDKSLYHSAYGFFYDRNVVCAGYALAYSYLLHRLGIECEYVVSTKMLHAWNSVQIDGKWYNVDLTYDDIRFYNNSMNVRGAMLHRCFMKSDEYMESERGYYHYGASTYDKCDMSDTAYDDYFWDEVNTNIYVIDGDYYYLDINSQEKSEKLIKRTVNGEESQIGSQKFAYAAVNATSVFRDGEGNTHNVTINDPLCRLVYLDNRFYITYGKYIVSYAQMNGRYKMYLIYLDDNYNLVGMGVNGDGELICQRRNDYETIVLDKDVYFKGSITTHNNSDTYNNYVDINLDGVVNAKDYVYINNRTAQQ